MREKCPELAVLVPAYRGRFSAQAIRSFVGAARRFDVVPTSRTCWRGFSFKVR